MVICPALCCPGHPNLCGCCHQFSAELVVLWLQEMAWSLLEIQAGIWPQGPSRCCVEKGANQASLRHNSPGCKVLCACKVRAQPMVWGGMGR